MRIWHEQLIPKLCQKHLCAMWREGLGAYKIITENKKGYKNHPAVKEFEHSPAALFNRMLKVRFEMLSRNYNPKPIFPRHHNKNGSVNEWQTLEEQINILRLKNCKCMINEITIEEVKLTAREREELLDEKIRHEINSENLLA